ncbi:Elicitor-responsive protein 1 [Acorus calamus]|uniref:Elicitor-responsive protein 1 n=1 Tax=Acorus calamus TaxID=4465 RepID=A0AAV9DRB6_ACOCL|nr:Elicitor-responsive protein 1 [Acorus calamus]
MNFSVSCQFVILRLMDCCLDLAGKIVPYVVIQYRGQERKSSIASGLGGLKGLEQENRKGTHEMRDDSLSLKCLPFSTLVCDIA